MELQNHFRWKSAKMAQHYVENTDSLKKKAASQIKAQLNNGPNPGSPGLVGEGEGPTLKRRRADTAEPEDNTTSIDKKAELKTLDEKAEIDEDQPQKKTYS